MLNVTKFPVGNGVNAPVEDNTKARMQTISIPGNPGNLNQTASEANLSAKFKNPQNKQDRIPADGQNQYESNN